MYQNLTCSIDYSVVARHLSTMFGTFQSTEIFITKEMQSIVHII